jgi:hypothetical protein
MKKFFILLFLSTSFVSYGQNCVPNTGSVGFDGLSSYIYFSSNSMLDISDSITIEAWIKASAWGINSAKGSIVCKHGWYFGEEGYVLRAGGNGELSFNIAGDSSGIPVSWREVVSTTGALQLNTWHHVAGTFDGQQLKIYIDGILAGTRAFPGTIVPSTDYSLKIGKLADDNQPDTRYWAGQIDEVRIWHKVLTQQQIGANLFHHIDPLTATDLAAYWRMNEGAGVSLGDLGPAAAVGTIVNGTWSTDVPFNEGPTVPLVSIISGGYLYSSASAGIQWELNGQPIANATGNPYLPLQNGNYTVTVTDSLGCSATSAPVTVTYVGIQELAAGELLASMFVSGRTLYFSASPEILEHAEISIHDISGSVLKRVPEGELTGVLSLDMLPAGIYLLNLRVGNDIISKRFFLN